MSNNKKLSVLAMFCFFSFVLPLGLFSQTRMNSETIVLQRRQLSIKLNVPQNWRVTREQRGTPIPFFNQTYNLRFELPSNEKAVFLITVGRTQTGEPITTEQFDRLVEGRISTLLPHAVEDTASYKNVTINSGYGRYCTLTDSSLVNKQIPPDEYLYLTMYFANYNNGCLVFATFLADEIDTETFNLVLEVLSGIEFIL